MRLIFLNFFFGMVFLGNTAGKISVYSTEMIWLKELIEGCERIMELNQEVLIKNPSLDKTDPEKCLKIMENITKAIKGINHYNHRIKSLESLERSGKVKKMNAF
jgi:hypothetical protein